MFDTEVLRASFLSRETKEVRDVLWLRAMLIDSVDLFVIHSISFIRLRLDSIDLIRFPID